jgi:hypothetical protein
MDRKVDDSKLLQTLPLEPAFGGFLPQEADAVGSGHPERHLTSVAEAGSGSRSGLMRASNMLTVREGLRRSDRSV